MTPQQQLRQILKEANAKSKFIDKQLARLEKLMDKLGPLLTKNVFQEFLRDLEVKDGMVLSTEQNIRKVQLIDKAYQTFMEQQGYKLITKMVEDMYSLSGLNLDLYEKLKGDKIQAGRIQRVVYERLGLNEKGELKRNGFMKGLLDDPAVKNNIKRFALDKVMGGAGYEDLRNGLQDVIQGSPDKMGSFKQFYRNAAYDTYARIDALNGKLYGDKLGLNYFIYAGTRRKTSRHFCVERKGKVFSREEAMQWKDLIGTKTTDAKGKKVPAGPIVSGEDVATYNPFVDRGGYGCVDDILWISDEIAFAKRPDLRPKK